MNRSIRLCGGNGCAPAGVKFAHRRGSGGVDIKDCNIWEIELFIGVDGGGPNTRALIMDGSGRGVGLGRSEPSNHDPVGSRPPRKR